MPIDPDKPTDLAAHPHIIQHVVDVLNEALALDPEAMRALVVYRVPCNRALADHPLIEVGGNSDGTFDVGLIGLLNGILRMEPIDGPIYYVLDGLAEGVERTEANQYEGRLTEFGVINTAIPQAQPGGSDG